MVKEQLITKTNFNHEVKKIYFQIGDLVLLWDKRREKLGMHGKFDSMWISSFTISRYAATNSYYLKYLDNIELPLLVNGHILKIYYPKIT